MKSIEIESYSFTEIMLIEMYQELNKKGLLENNLDIKNYTDFIDQEKTHTVPLNALQKGKEYVPLGLNAIPTAEYIIISQLDDFSQYIDTAHGKVYFNHINRVIDFPLTKNLGDALADTLIFQTVNEQIHFITMLKLKFSTWHFSVHRK